LMQEIALGYQPKEVQALTKTYFIIADALKERRCSHPMIMCGSLMLGRMSLYALRFSRRRTFLLRPSQLPGGVLHIPALNAAKVLAGRITLQMQVP